MTTTTDARKIALTEIALDGKLTLELVKEWLEIDHNHSDDLLRLLIASFDLGGSSL
jgi:hypothetical protein